MIEAKMNELYQKAIQLSLLYIPKLILGILVLIIGWWLIKRVVNFTHLSMKKRDIEPTFASFSRSAISVTLKVILLITVAGIIGIKTTSLVAVLGAAGLAIGLALQGSLSNFAGGALILTFKPFKVGDVIESGVYIGEVKEIQLFSTTLLTPEHKTVIIPNSLLSNGTIVNLSTSGNIRAEILVNVTDDSNIEQITSIAMNIIQTDARILKTPEPKCIVSGFGNSALNFTVHFFTRTEDRTIVESEIRRRILEEFTKQKVKQSSNAVMLKTI